MLRRLSDRSGCEKGPCARASLALRYEQLSPYSLIIPDTYRCDTATLPSSAPGWGLCAASSYVNMYLSFRQRWTMPTSDGCCCPARSPFIAPVSRLQVTVALACDTIVWNLGPIVTSWLTLGAPRNLGSIRPEKDRAGRLRPRRRVRRRARMRSPSLNVSQPV